MTAPKRRLSKARRDSRRSHHALKKPAVANCTNCGSPKRPHVVCRQCGHYRGIQVTEGVEE